MKTCSTAFLVIAIMITLLSNKYSTKNSLLWQEILMMFLSVPQSLNQFHGTFHGLKTTNWFITWSPGRVSRFHKNPSCYDNFLVLIFLCYLLNMSSFCVGSISWCCFVVTLLRCSSDVPLFRGIPIVLLVFGCLFHQCFGVSPAFRFSGGVSCSGVPGFRLCLQQYRTLLIGQ